MNCRNGRQGRPRTIRLLTVAGKIALAGVLAGLGAASCSWDTAVDFDDYVGVNLIESRSLNSGYWYFADGLDQDTDPGAPFDYVEFEEVGSAVYGSLPSGANGPVYRLEVVNLFADGTFEQETAGDGAGLIDNFAGWVDDDSDDTGDSANGTITFSSAIDGNRSLSLVFDNISPYFAADLSWALGDSTFSDTESYAYHFDFRMGIQTFGMELHNNSPPPGPGTPSYSTQWSRVISRGKPISSTFIYAFPGSLGEDTDRYTADTSGENIIQPETGLTWFSFGGFDSTTQKGAINAVIDNIRFVRADQNHHVRLPIPVADAGRPELASGGTYTITLWARNDITAGNNGTPETANRIPARFLSAGLDPRYGNSIPVTKTHGVPGTKRKYVGNLAGWRQLTYTIETPAMALPTGLPPETVVFDLVLEVGHSAAGSRFKDAGSVLIADVELRWSPE